MATTHSTSVEFGDCPRTPTSSRHISIYNAHNSPYSGRHPKSPKPSPSRSSITVSSISGSSITESSTTRSTITGSTWSLKKPLSVRSIKDSAKRLFRRDLKASPVSSSRRNPIPIWGSVRSQKGTTSTESHENPKPGALDWLKTSPLRKKHERSGKLLLLPHLKNTVLTGQDDGSSSRLKSSKSYGELLDRSLTRKSSTWSFRLSRRRLSHDNALFGLDSKTLDRDAKEVENCPIPSTHVEAATDLRPGIAPKCKLFIRCHSRHWLPSLNVISRY